MIFVDTNVLIRLATHDVPGLVDRAEAALLQCASGELAVTEAVAEECCFVLEFHAAYRLERATIHAALTTLLGRNVFTVSDEIWDALSFYGAHPKLDFVDCLLAVKAGKKRSRVLTFDKDLLAALG